MLAAATAVTVPVIAASRIANNPSYNGSFTFGKSHNSVLKLVINKAATSPATEATATSPS